MPLPLPFLVWDERSNVETEDVQEIGAGKPASCASEEHATKHVTTLRHLATQRVAFVSAFPPLSVRFPWIRIQLFSGSFSTGTVPGL